MKTGDSAEQVSLKAEPSHIYQRPALTQTRFASLRRHFVKHSHLSCQRSLKKITEAFNQSNGQLPNQPLLKCSNTALKSEDLRLIRRKETFAAHMCRTAGSLSMFPWCLVSPRVQGLVFSSFSTSFLIVTHMPLFPTVM